jgi:L-asparaginase
MTRIMVIHTGGTIAMAPTPQGLAPMPGLLEEEITALGLGGDISVTSLAPLIDSAHATPADWNRIAQRIAGAHEACDGFVVTHGTDTLAFTAAALCFALKGLRKPVILTGSMVPLRQPGSDGPRNLSDALMAAATAPPGVWAQFGGRLMHGARLRKEHSQATSAFADTPAPMAPRQAAAALDLMAYAETEIAILTTECDGAVLRVYGAGTLPDDPALAKALRAAKARGTLMIAVSQCAEGGITLGSYAAGDLLLTSGVIDGRDMTPEAAYAKLAHILSQPEPKRAALLASPLCGEFQ